MAFTDWEPVIGLEIHAQMMTASKMFSWEPNVFAANDNENTSPVSLGLPGALPVPNQKAIEFAVKLGLALNCQIRNRSVFARKNYFYPDLPKGYQISQHDQPICESGFVEIFLDGEVRRVGVTRAHLEEDAGKSTHHDEYSLINLNRAGIPLVEIVSEPDLRSAAEAAEYARTVRRILRYLNICDGNLEEGSMRCDCNVSVRRKGETRLGTKVELKNINSFRFIEKAVEYEIQRQIDLKEAGEVVVQETRLYDSAKNRTASMRSKEEAHDYRYFPDPDLLPVELTAGLIEKLRQELPELPVERAKRFQTFYGLPVYDSFVLTVEKNLADYYEVVAEKSRNPKSASNWVMVELMRELKEAQLDVAESKIAAIDLARLIELIDGNTISGKMAKAVFGDMWATGQSPDSIIKAQGLMQITDAGAVEKIVDQVMAMNPGQVNEYRSGKTKLFGFFVGQVMKASKGSANPDLVNQILTEKLKS